MATAHSATTSVYPPVTRADRREHHYVSNENRDARLQLDNFQKQKKRLLSLLGGKKKTFETLQRQRETQEWARILPMPENGNIERCFDLFVEANEHGDVHILLRDWSDQLSKIHGRPVNFIIPFLRINLWDVQGVKKGIPTPHLWVVINDTSDHMRITETNTRKSPLLGATNFGNNMLAHVDNKEWRRRRFGMIFAVSPRANATYFHKMERHAKMLISKIEKGEIGQFTYGQSSPLLSFNIHSLLEHTAFSIAADCLYGVDDVRLSFLSCFILFFEL